MRKALKYYFNDNSKRRKVWKRFRTMGLTFKQHPRRELRENTPKFVITILKGSNSS